MYSIHPVSPELLPLKNGEMVQQTENLIGPYILHDFFLYYFVRRAWAPAKIARVACHVFADEFSRASILEWLNGFLRRFISQQFKRSCLPDGPATGSVHLSPRTGFRIPSDVPLERWRVDLSAVETSS